VSHSSPTIGIYVACRCISSCSFVVSLHH